MKLSERQKKIVEIVKLHQPLSGEKISELLDISRATLRPDLSFLTLVGILKATPKIGYTYSGLDLETLFFFDTFQKEVAEIMTSPVLVTHDSYIQDAIITLFMYDADAVSYTHLIVRPSPFTSMGFRLWLKFQPLSTYQNG